MMKNKNKSLFALILRQILFNTAKLQEHLQRPTEPSQPDLEAVAASY